MIQTYHRNCSVSLHSENANEKQTIKGTIWVQNCINGKTVYMLSAKNYSKWFKSLTELINYAKYYDIELDLNQRYL